MCVCSSPPPHFLCPPLSLLVTIGTLLCCEAASVWWRSSFVPCLASSLQEMSYNSCLLCLTYFTWCDVSTSLPCCWMWCNVPLFVAERHCSVCVPHPVYPSSVLTHLGFIHVLAIVHNTAMNTGVHLSFTIMVFSGSALEGGIAVSCGTSLLSFHFVLFSVVDSFPPFALQHWLL